MRQKTKKTKFPELNLKSPVRLYKSSKINEAVEDVRKMLRATRSHSN